MEKELAKLQKEWNKTKKRMDREARQGKMDNLEWLAQDEKQLREEIEKILNS